MDNKNLKECSKVVATENDEGLRLDKFLIVLLPETGLRQRRRIVENGLVTVNGRSAKPSLKMFTGAEIVLFERTDATSTEDILPHLSIIAETDDYAAVLKPAGMHSASIAGSMECSAQDCLDELFMEKTPILVNRLDHSTSGILLVAFGHEQARLFKEYEEEGKVEKEYFARVIGNPDSEFVVKKELDTDSRTVTKVLSEDAERLRWSYADRVSDLGNGITLVKVRIAKGARHQIRAHLAYAGFPIVGDTVYGTASADGKMYLHNHLISFKGFKAECEPDWD
ncbi:23S rRNA pseudouridine1911/1915/1917 synthase [Maridesulfovibrio ferrireducens]|uniref:23S rRNA pseudouridine1911/1915/1917 synthase n=1 Tax=Maridesulfovibrio ferrireducens TaxID=246191 RepID=A0A1G9JUK9_9BACT|nr:RluA family pseudouridine synthase [Maridesulfovibrio ferrireducens]SDL41227.1 23S rRNA pseudouridine1911/1915/1917 synthase [Maridesulfovibrio ferrireducens]